MRHKQKRGGEGGKSLEKKEKSWHFLTPEAAHERTNGRTDGQGCRMGGKFLLGRSSSKINSFAGSR
jgi:hypothetical protein